MYIKGQCALLICETFGCAYILWKGNKENVQKRKRRGKQEGKMNGKKWKFVYHS